MYTYKSSVNILNIKESNLRTIKGGRGKLRSDPAGFHFGTGANKNKSSVIPLTTIIYQDDLGLEVPEEGRRV